MTTSRRSRPTSPPPWPTRAAFPPYQRRQARSERQQARSVAKGHGRVERRALTSTAALNDYLDWPDVGQVFRLERTRTAGGGTTTEVVYGITSLARERADADRLLELVRAHWGIENRLHHVRDETLGEDRCRVRKGAAAEILAAVRNVAVYLLERVGAASKAAATRRLAARPREALRLVLT